MANGGTHWWDVGQEDLRRQRKTVQMQAIKDALGPGVRIYPDDTDPSTAQYLYKERTILTLTGQRTTAVLQEFGLSAADAATNVPIPGVTTITVPANSAWADHEAAFTRLDERFDAGYAMPDSAVHITISGGCPATEPTPSSDNTPSPAPPGGPQANAGQNVSVVVLDSGVRSPVVGQHNWLAGVTGAAENPGQLGDVYQGHGTFIAGVVRSIAPMATVDVRSFGYRHGALLESSLAPMLLTAINQNHDIINMSAGVSTRNNKAPITLQVACNSLGNPGCKTVLVAAAGNDMSTDEFFPASCTGAGIVSVGALDKNGNRAGYSNHGPLVQVYAQGSQMVNAYPKGTHNYGEPPYGPGAHDHFNNGMAIWDGTSFSTPLVAGMIAACMTNHGLTARDAWAYLLAKAASQPAPDSGPRLFPGNEA